MADERTADAEMIEEGITGVEMVDEEDCVLLAVMGVTGAGKSSLIKAITGSEEIVVGNSLTSGILIDIRPFLAIILNMQL
jgi:predicted GTPase